PIADCLNVTAPGANLSTNEVHYLMELCVFYSAVIDGISKWCGLFDKEEWEGFEYAKDLDKCYGTGFGQGPVEGVVYINELIARLTSSP
ncbi:hypothetical protein FB446DRAFT_600895, partial [Lentinula raphanica]